MNYDPTRCERCVSGGSGWSTYDNQCSRKWTERVTVDESPGYGEPLVSIERRFCRQHAKNPYGRNAARPEPVHAIELTFTVTMRIRGIPSSAEAELERWKRRIGHGLPDNAAVVGSRRVGCKVLNADEIESARTGAARQPSSAARGET